MRRCEPASPTACAPSWGAEELSALARITRAVPDRFRPPLTPSALRVWATDTTSVQVCWGHLPAGHVSMATEERAIEFDHPGGPGATTIDGLVPATDHSIRVTVDDRPVTSGAVGARTLTPPGGEVLARVATVSDLHIGAHNWGFLRTMSDRFDEPDPPPVRCARGAITEAIAWGADRLVIKGDAAHHRVEDHFAQLGALLDEFDDLPITLLRGNHDVDDRSDMDVPSTVGRRAIPFVTDVAVEELPGIRIVSVDTTIERRGIGTLERNGPIALDAAASSSGPVLMLLHHQIQKHAVPTHHPPGISRRGGRPFLRDLAAANPNTWLSSGHTHRNRARTAGPIQLSEVASTRDWPGVWAGYEIREGGITQVVRRVETPSAATWHEYSRGALLGAWSAWSPGPLDQRCLVKHWI